jgi:shikimate kinase
MISDIATYLDNKNIVIIGFKHVGKSTLGKCLAAKCGLAFIDLDEQIELIFEKKYNRHLAVRDIMNDLGEISFRDIEHEVLVDVIKMQSTIISVGGGTPLENRNAAFFKDQIVIYVVAPRDIVFERIMINGRPAFFPLDVDPYDYFNRLWDEREKIYEKMANVTIINDGSIELVVESILLQLASLCNMPQTPV